MMTDGERLVCADLVRTLSAIEWLHDRCLSCRRQRKAGHVCSCRIRVALRNARRVLGEVEPGLEDDDLIVERALRDLADVDVSGRRTVVRAAVDAAIAMGGRG